MEWINVYSKLLSSPVQHIAYPLTPHTSRVARMYTPIPLETKTLILHAARFRNYNKIIQKQS